MTPVLTQFAGFMCTEGQQSSSFKQTLVTLITVGLLALIATSVARRWASKSVFAKTVLALVMILSVCIGLVVIILGPFLYTDWGCDFIIYELITGTSGY